MSLLVVFSEASTAYHKCKAKRSPNQPFHECVYNKKEKEGSAHQNSTQVRTAAATTAATTASDQRSNASHGAGFDIFHSGICPQLFVEFHRFHAFTYIFLLM